MTISQESVELTSDDVEALSWHMLTQSSVLRRISERRCGGGSGGLPPEKIFQVYGGFTHFF